MKITREMISLCEVERNYETLTLMTFKDYLMLYGEEIEEYYEVNVGVEGDDEIDTPLSILCLVDTGMEPTHKRRKKSPGKRAGLERRLKFRHRYTYQNPLNRIAAYCVLEDSDVDSRVMKLSLICSSYFSHYKGVGTDLMNLLIALTTLMGYREIVLELANEYSQEPDSDIEDNDIEDDDIEDDIDIDKRDMVHTLSHELWRQCMRLQEKRPYYNIDAPYIEQAIQEYLDHTESLGDLEDIMEDSEEDYEEDYEEDSEVIQTPQKKKTPYEEMRDEECGYHGYWNQQAKQSQASLIRFYNRFGFREDETKRCHFSTMPYPTYVKRLSCSGVDVIN